MTEQEIVNVLKENKTKGVAYLFLPQDVWDWIGNNLNNPKLIYLSPDGKWRFFFGTDFDDYDNVVFALPEYYQVKKESEGGWVEFEMDDDGDFAYLSESEKEENCKTYYPWFAWHRFLEDSRVNERGFTAFGGWQYAKSNTWFMTPQIKAILADLITYKDSFSPSHYATPAVCDCKPAIPTKIRFWRETK